MYKCRCDISHISLSKLNIYMPKRHRESEEAPPRTLALFIRQPCSRRHLKIAYLPVTLIRWSPPSAKGLSAHYEQPCYKCSRECFSKSPRQYGTPYLHSHCPHFPSFSPEQPFQRGMRDPWEKRRCFHLIRLSPLELALLSCWSFSKTRSSGSRSRGHSETQLFKPHAEPRCLVSYRQCCLRSFQTCLQQSAESLSYFNQRALVRAQKHLSFERSKTRFSAHDKGSLL